MLFRALKIKMADKHNCLTIFLILNFEHENALLNKGGRWDRTQNLSSI
jgi:hypothetical protein